MKGVVVKSTGSWYKVNSTEGVTFDCRIKGKIRLDNSRSTNPIAVGDIVTFEIDKDNVGVISGIDERKNHIIRKASNLSKESHVIAANVDMAYLVVTLHSPQTLLSFIDRFLAAAEAYSITSTIVINKADLYTSKEEIEAIAEWKETYEKAGYEVLVVSTHTHAGIDTLKQHMQHKVSVFAGNSGVGKSSLIQLLIPDAQAKVSSISKSHNKGQHTTTFAEMYELPQGGYIIDTPGIKAFGLLDFEKETLAHYFPEIFRYSKQCKYNNCTHVQEPNCAVVDAVSEGNIAISRYESYISCISDLNTKHRK